jgi:hypothetical protein
MECGDGHDHPRLIREHPPCRQTRGQEIRTTSLSLYLYATDAIRIRGPRPRRSILHQHLPRGPQVRPCADASQWSAGVRSLPKRRRRDSSRGRPLCPHPQGRPDLRHDSLRRKRASMVRPPAIAPEPIAISDQRLCVRGSGQSVMADIVAKTFATILARQRTLRGSNKCRLSEVLPTRFTRCERFAS